MTDQVRKLRRNLRFYEAQVRVMVQDGIHSAEALRKAHLFVAQARGRLGGALVLAQVLKPANVEELRAEYVRLREERSAANAVAERIELAAELRLIEAEGRGQIHRAYWLRAQLAHEAEGGRS